MATKSDVKITKPPILFPETQKIISKIEKKLDGVFITYCRVATAACATMTWRPSLKC